MRGSDDDGRRAQFGGQINQRGHWGQLGADMEGNLELLAQRHSDDDGPDMLHS
jgi:hypothetical protein